MTLLKSTDTSSPQWEGIQVAAVGGYIQVAAVGGYIQVAAVGGYIQVAAVEGYPGRRSGKYSGRRKVRYPGSHKEGRLAWREGKGEISRSPQDGGLKIAGRRSTEVA